MAGSLSAAAAAAAGGAAAACSAATPPPPSPAQAVDFLMLVQKLKTTPRTGWVKMGVRAPESIADHMHRMGLMAMLVAGGGAPGVDAGRCVKLAIVHDIAECIVGDITPTCGVSDADKHAAEAAAVATLAATLGGGAAAAEIAALWREYDAGASPEARLVKDFDKLEMILQAAEYEAAQPGLALQEFFDSTAGKWRTDLGRAWAAEICARRGAARAAAAAGAAGGVGSHT